MRVGLFRGEVANRHPAVKWIGLAEKNPNRAGDVAPKIGADFVTQSHVELLQRPEVTCAIIATDEHLHVEMRMQHKDGQHRWVLCRGIAVRDAGSGAVGAGEAGGGDGAFGAGLLVGVGTRLPVTVSLALATVRQPMQARE